MYPNKKGKGKDEKKKDETSPTFNWQVAFFVQWADDKRGQEFE